MENSPGKEFDLAVISCGLAGMAARIHLSEAGLKVLCIEAHPNSNDPIRGIVGVVSSCSLEVSGISPADEPRESE